MDKDPIDSSGLRRGPLVSSTHELLLTQPVTNKEIRKVLWSIKDTKSHGPDDYNSSFYKKAWSVVNEDVTRAIQ